jgi:diphosphomevalonate decarboxylase
MQIKSATAISHPNIAFIKYWGNRDQDLRIPSNGSISMNLGGLFTRTRVEFDPQLKTDHLILGGNEMEGPTQQRVSDFLSIVRTLSKTNKYALVSSENNFPMGTGIASSASAFSALALAASKAAGLQLDKIELSRLARRGSGSASRSIPGGFVEWQAGNSDDDSFATSIAPQDHWDISDCVAIVSQEHKATGSVAGHALAASSPLQTARIAEIPQHLQTCRDAILERDFGAFAEICEHDTNMMHAVMMTSQPSLIYWQPSTLAIMHAVRAWRAQGLPVCYTIDAGPNVHVICERDYQEKITQSLHAIPGVTRVLSAQPGGPTRLIG